MLLPAEELIPGANLAHDARWAGVGKPGHVEANLGDDDRGRGRPDPGDLIEPGDRISERGQVLPDLGVDGGDVGVDGVNTGQHPGQQEPVMIIEGA